MNVLREANKHIIEQIGGYQYKTKGKKYRMNKYCLETEIEDGIIIHNFFTGASVFIRPFEYINIFTDYPCDYAEFLVNNYFIVPEDFDERSLVQLLRERKSIPFTDNYLDHPKSFTVLSTTRCNARCFYCYENKVRGKKHMTKETAEKIAKYIIDVAPKNQEITLSWFGGEPLYNISVIDIITSRVKSAGFNIVGSMISNGYLFDSKVIMKAKYDWNIRNVQITLDGSKEVYNKVKNYIYEGSAYERVLDNIQLLLEQNIQVSIRMNCDEYNSESLKELIKELHERFKNYNNFSMYVWPIFDEENQRSDEQKINLYKALSEIDTLIQECGYKLAHGIEYDIRGLHCMVDGGDGVVISPNGDLGVCEHYIDSDFFSHIDNPSEKNMDILKSWRNYSEYTELCDNCPIYPICLRMKKCPDENICDQYQKEYVIDHYKKCLVDSWNTHKQFHKQQESSCNKEE